MNLRMKTGAEGHPTVPNLIAILLTNGPTGFRIVLRICSGTSPFSRGFPVSRFLVWTLTIRIEKKSAGMDPKSKAMTIPKKQVHS